MNTQPTEHAEVQRVWVVQPLDDIPHIFSTEENAIAYADSREEVCVCWDYIVDQPERTTARQQ